MELLLVLLALSLVGWVYYSGLTRNVGRLTSSQPVGYYALQAEAFLHGQLHLKIETDPRLLELENPYAGPQGTNRPHDMSYFQGRFYLYYGVTPVLLLYLPWRLLTGTYLHDAAGTVIMLYGGFLLAALWLWRIRRQRFPKLSALWLPALVLLLGLGAPLAVEAHNPTFYAVPIAGAFFCLMVAFTALNEAVRAAQTSRQCLWLAAASLAWGLAVGARPIYVAGLLVLAVSVAWLWWQTQADKWRWRGLRLWVAGVAPAALIGGAMMVYNFLRFDHPLEFGIRFSMASADIREARLVGPEFIGKNLHLYLLQTADWIRYFPFIVTNGRPYGILPYLSFVLVTIALPLTWRRAGLRDPHWILTTGTLVGAGLANLALLCLFFGGEERYLLDFAPPLLLAAATTALALVDGLSSRSRHAWLVPASLVFLVGYGLFTGSMLTLARRGGGPESVWLERLLNRPALWLEQATNVAYGPLELDVRFPTGRSGTVEPLLVTGHLNGTGDLVTVRYVDDEHIQLGVFHLGDGGPQSAPLEIDFDQVHRLRIELGSLYPLSGHPRLTGWSEGEVDRLRRSLVLSLNGEPVLQANVSVYPSTPQGIRIGRNDLAGDVSEPTFSGEILAARRTEWTRPAIEPSLEGSGPVRLHVRLPSPMNDNPLPLISTGQADRGDILYVQRTGPTSLRFTHDNVGGNSVRSPETFFTPGEEQVIEIEMGSLYAADEAVDEAVRRRLRITFNGQPVIDTSRPFNPSAPEDVAFGYNSFGASTASRFFPGTIARVERIAAAPIVTESSDWGPLSFTLRFPTIRDRGPEPLFISGHTGRADVVFVLYEPDGRIRLAHDHWSIGVHTGESFAAPAGATHQVEIHSGSLVPPAGHPKWRQKADVDGGALRAQLVVRVDGKVVLNSPFEPYSNPSGEIYLGVNSIGASTCSAAFGGEITDLTRMPW